MCVGGDACAISHEFTRMYISTGSGVCVCVCVCVLVYLQLYDTKELCQVRQYESGCRAAECLTVAVKTNTKFSTLEKSNAMKMATMAMMGIDPCTLSKTVLCLASEGNGKGVK